MTRRVTDADLKAVAQTVANRWLAEGREIPGKAPQTAQIPRVAPVDGPAPVSGRRKAPKRPRPKVPSEHEEQVVLVELLTLGGLDFFAVPNGGKRGKAEAGRFRAEGVRAGVPDLHIVTRAPGAPAGAVIEMKRQDGVPSDVSPEQRRWLAVYASVGVATLVAFGWERAIVWLRGLGYPMPRVGGGA